jgi:OmcA/MtrC family decaheme c-type cytochrome
MRSEIRNGFVRISAVLLVAAGAALLLSTDKPTFTVHDKAYYLDPKQATFVRPGLVTTVTGAQIATDGTITAQVKITDPKGLPLDKDGITTPGAVSISLIAAYIPADQEQYVAYTARTVTSTITGASAVQASADSGGTWTKTADGQYTYTFKTKAPQGYDATATHTIGVYSTRNLTEFDAGVAYSDSNYNFIPAGGTVTKVRDVIRTESCNKCHTFYIAGLHGGSRQTMDLCVLCHTPQSTDPDTGNTLDLKVMAHKIHAGENLPSVQAGTPYQIIGFNNSVNDYSTVAFPTINQDTPPDVHCEACHVNGNDKATQKNAYLTPSRAACGACHDNVNFATGENHANLPQPTDNQCANCHIPQGEYYFDISIIGAHATPELVPTLPGINFSIKSVTGKAGEKPTVVYSVANNAGQPYAMSSFVPVAGQPQRLALVLAGPALDYGYTQFGSDTKPNGYISEDPSKLATCDSSGVCTYQFQHAIPANATGTYSVGIEGRLGFTINPGTLAQRTGEYGGVNQVSYFSVDGSNVVPWREVVSIDSCNMCHGDLRLHGQNRNQVKQCVACHNPSETDAARRPADQAPPQTVEFAYMIHRIHTGENSDYPYVIYGFGGSTNDFGDVRYPALLTSCDKCHVNNGQQIDGLASYLNPVITPRQYTNPTQGIAAACGGCHTDKTAWAHFVANTNTLGESCEVCHGSAAEFSVDKVHAQ